MIDLMTGNCNYWKIYDVDILQDVYSNLSTLPLFKENEIHN